MKAIIVREGGKEPELADVDKPEAKDDQILIKVKATALNPVDYIIAKYGILVEKFPCVLGGDVSGVVEAVGPNVTKYKPGDEVYSFVRLGRGTFSEYAVLHHDVCAVKPAHLSFEQAATFPIGTWTAALGLYTNLQIPVPSKKENLGKPMYLLVWGGASSVGAYAVQLGKLSGCTVIATCSPKNFEYVRSLGASHTLDYRAEDVTEQIRALTNGQLRYALNCVSEQTIYQCAQCMATSTQAGEHFPTISTVSGTPDDFKSRHPDIKLMPINLGPMYDLPDVFMAVTRNLAEISPLIESKSLVPNPVELIPHGLNGIPDGLKRLETGVSGVKLVAIVDQTS